MNVARHPAYTIPDVDSMTDDIESPLHLPSLEDKAILVDFDGGRLSSDGGLILLSDPDNQIGLTRDLAAVLRDPRDPRRVNFTLHDLLKQRVGIGHMKVYIFGKPDPHTLHIAFKANKTRAETPRSSKGSC